MKTRKRIRVVVKENSVDRKGNSQVAAFDRTVLAISRADALRKCEADIRKMAAERITDPTIKRMSIFIGTSYRRGRFTAIGHWWRMAPMQVIL